MNPLELARKRRVEMGRICLNSLPYEAHRYMRQLKKMHKPRPRRSFVGKVGPIVDVIAMGGALEEPIQPIRQSIEQVTLQQYFVRFRFGRVRIETKKTSRFRVTFKLGRLLIGLKIPHIKLFFIFLNKQSQQTHLYPFRSLGVLGVKHAKVLPVSIEWKYGTHAVTRIDIQLGAFG